MAPRSSSAFDDAVQLVLAGMAPECAWRQVGMPGKSKDAGLHNIRKRARLEKQRRASAPRTPASPPEGNAAVDADNDSSSSAPSALSSTRKNSETKVFRLRTDQVDKQAKATEALA